MESSWRANTWTYGLSSIEVNVGAGSPAYQQLRGRMLDVGPYRQFACNVRIGIYAVLVLVPTDMSDPYIFALSPTSGLIPHFPYGIPVEPDVLV